jgi:protein-ribulosamine 3-kinase
MFEAEAEGLWELTRTGAIRVPAVQRVGIEDGRAIIAMEHIERSGKESADAKLGAQLAQLHRTTQAKFGWHRDNTIGLTPQRNTAADNWLAFYRNERLGFQLDLLAKNVGDSALEQAGRRLLGRLDAFFSGHEPQPSLLHGDLWGGNWFTASSGEPVIFDPACYYGDREADIAMTYLFGGFAPAFYAAYEAAWPLDEGHERRRDLYNLYHVLNHANLFGGGYLRQARDLIERLS